MKYPFFVVVALQLCVYLNCVTYARRRCSLVLSQFPSSVQMYGQVPEGFDWQALKYSYKSSYLDPKLA